MASGTGRSPVPDCRTCGPGHFSCLSLNNKTEPKRISSGRRPFEPVSVFAGLLASLLKCLQDSVPFAFEKVSGCF